MHASVNAMVETLNAAWGWRESDRILHALPLHHVHGVVNALYCPHAAGAAVEVLQKFDARAAWQRLQVEMAIPNWRSYG